MQTALQSQIIGATGRLGKSQPERHEEFINHVKSFDALEKSSEMFQSLNYSTEITCRCADLGQTVPSF